MLHLIKSFLYAVALLSIYWMAHQPPESVTLADWAKQLQSPHMEGLAISLTVFLALADQAIKALFIGPFVLASGFKKTYLGPTAK